MKNRNGDNDRSTGCCSVLVFGQLTAHICRVAHEFDGFQDIIPIPNGIQSRFKLFHTSVAEKLFRKVVCEYLMYYNTT